MGLRNNGIAKHIIVRKKTNRAGIGADKAINLNVGNHWWERVFDDLLKDDADDPLRNGNGSEEVYEEYDVGLQQGKNADARKNSTMSRSDRIMSKSMKTLMYTSMRFVRETGKYGKSLHSEAEKKNAERKRRKKEKKERKRKEREDATEENDTSKTPEEESSSTKKHKMDKKRKRKDEDCASSSKKKKRSKKASPESDSSSSEEDTNADLMDKYHTKTSSVLSQSFFQATNGATLKKYRQVGKQNRLRAQDEKLLKEWGRI